MQYDNDLSTQLILVSVSMT